MALPRIASLTYDLELPLSKKKILFRPFVVKEQRNLLVAMESEDASDVERNIKQVLQNCTLTEDIDIDRLPLIDVEYYFLNLRARSVGEVVENKYKCTSPRVSDGAECGNIMDVKVNLLDIKVNMNGNAGDIVQLTDKIKVKLKYPEFSVMRRAQDATNVSDFTFALMAESIDYIFGGEQMYHAHESTPAELVEFVESLPQAQFEKLEKFFENLPRLEKKIEFRCTKCGADHVMDVEGLESFFV